MQNFTRLLLVLLAVLPLSVAAPAAAQDPTDPAPIDLGDITALPQPAFRPARLAGAAAAVHTYQFTLTAAQAVGLGLRQQDADADLYLTEATGPERGRSEAAGTAKEWIQATLLAGTYTVRVEAREAGENQYVLRYGVSAPDADEVARLEAEQDNDGDDADDDDEAPIDLGDITTLPQPAFRPARLAGDAAAVQTYQFTLTAAQAVGLGVRQQDADADLYLADATGTERGRSAAAGTAKEWIQATLLAGTYTVRVEAREAGENQYVLRYGVSAPDADEVARLEAEQDNDGEDEDNDEDSDDEEDKGEDSDDDKGEDSDDDDEVLGARNPSPPAVTTCSGGMAGIYPCSRVDLMSFLALADIGGGEANDIWGWTDALTGKEYAIMGRTNGTSFVDVSDPVNPIYLGNLPPRYAYSKWRDIKVYADHAFIVTEADNSGMQVFDLTQLRMVDSPPTTFSETAHYPDFQHAHNIVINEDSGFAYAVGTNTCNRGLHMINIQTPTNPAFAGCFSADGFTHDAQCVNYAGPDLDHQGKEICFNSNNYPNMLTIVDVTNKAAPAMLSRTGYSGSQFTHQGWLTEDHAYFLLGDESDETENPDVTNTRTYMWDVSNLDAPALIGFHDSTTTATDHNLYVKGSYVYQANYRAGLRILNIIDIAYGRLSEQAFFDIYPASDSPGLIGAWSNYPFFDSGIVIVSGIKQGLFILRPNVEPPPSALTVSFGAAQYTATEGGAAATVTVQLSEAPTRPIDIPLTSMAATGATADDYTDVPASVSFGADDTAQTVTVTAVNDAVDDDGESVTLALGVSLSHGVTVGSPAETTVSLADNDDVRGRPSILAVELTSDPGPDGLYVIGDAIEASVRFNKTVTVTGAPQLELTIGSDTPQATYRDSRNEVVWFVYTVAGGDHDNDGVSIAANSLTPSGTIWDGTNQEALLSHSAVATSPNQRVNGIRPMLQEAEVNLTALTLLYDKMLDETSVPATSAFTVRVDGVVRSVTNVSVHGRTVTLTLSQAVPYGEDGATVSYTPGSRPLRDLIDNPAAALSDQPVTSETPLYDTDVDGLIEITTPDQLNAMRYDLDGDGEPRATGATAYQAAFPDDDTPLRCANGCTGYELFTDLDLSGRNWNPIGADLISSGYEPFAATFEGNGHTIANLYINRPRWSTDSGFNGLFRATASSAAIRNLGLVNVNVTISVFRNVAGGLVGANAGTIQACYATGRGSGGFTGGLVGTNTGTITASYAAVRVIGDTYNAGGLVGYNFNGTITSSYATGFVSGSLFTEEVGGLVGRNFNGTITDSYATGPVSGTIYTNNVSGLVGANTGGTITTSYWDTTTSGSTTSAGGIGRTTAALQASTGSTTTWDHGTASQYSALRGTGDWKDFGYQLRAGPTLTATGSATQVVLTWEVDTSPWDPDPPSVTYTVYRNTGTTVSTVAENVSGLQYTTTGATDTYQVAAVVNGGEIVRSGWTAVASVPNQPPTFPSTETGRRSIPENTTGNIGAPVAATDPDADPPTYSLSGTDAADFSITTSTGQLRTTAAFDHETKDTYQVTVSVHDGTPDTTIDDTVAVTITVTDVNEAPAFDEGTSTTRSVTENTVAGQDIENPVTATDPDTRTPAYADLTYWLSGSDAGVFLLDAASGQLRTREPLDYESRAAYTVTVHVRDGNGTDDPTDEDDTIRVRIEVGNVDEAGMVELSSHEPQEKQALTAMLSDLDGSLSGISWQWARAATRSGPGTPIPGATSSGATTARYPPSAADVGQYVRATATTTTTTATTTTTTATTTATTRPGRRVGEPGIGVLPEWHRPAVGLGV